MKFNKILESIAPHRHAVEKFDDFLQMAVCALSMGRMEKEYEEIIKRYSPEEAKQFAHVLGQLFEDYEEKSKDGQWCDILGSYFEETGGSNARMGQFFTPETICNLMAKISDNGQEAETINDPCSGSGRNLIAHCRLNPNNRFKCFYVAQDLDYRCALMTVINMVMYGMKGVVIHMNAITLKVFRGYRIWMPETGLFVQPLSVSECEQYLFSEKEEAEVTEVIPQTPEVFQPFQTTLF